MWDALELERRSLGPHHREGHGVAEKDHELSLLPSQDAKDRGKLLAGFSQL